MKFLEEYKSKSHHSDLNNDFIGMTLKVGNTTKKFNST